jgi:uncharacterized protein
VSAARRVLWAIGAPVRAFLIGGIKLYRATLAGWLGGQCRFYPSCSQFAEEAVRVHGALRGSALTVWRILRCNPFGAGGPEPVPPRRHVQGDEYDVVIRRTGSVHRAKGART